MTVNLYCVYDVSRYQQNKNSDEISVCLLVGSTKNLVETWNSVLFTWLVHSIEYEVMLRLFCKKSEFLGVKCHVEGWTGDVTFLVVDRLAKTKRLLECFTNVTTSKNGQKLKTDYRWHSHFLGKSVISYKYYQMKMVYDVWWIHWIKNPNGLKNDSVLK